MLLDNMAGLMISLGYQRVPVNVPNIFLFGIRNENQSKYILLVDTGLEGMQEPAALKGIIWQLSYKLRQREPYCDLLSIVMTQDVTSYKVLNEMEDQIWFVDTREQRLMIFENHENDYREIQDKVEQILSLESDNIPNKEGSSAANKRKEKFPICSLVLVIINVVIYMIMYDIISVEQCYNVVEKLGLIWSRVIENGEYYRLVTCMFIHSDIGHVFNNMLTLFFVGKLLEQVMSKAQYMIIYMGSGLAGGLISMGYHMYIQEKILSIGASGAVFGLIGAMICIAVVYREKFMQISRQQIVIFLILSVYAGISEQNIDNAAHVGGFIGGVILTAILMRKHNRKERVK